MCYQLSLLYGNIGGGTTIFLLLLIVVFKQNDYFTFFKQTLSFIYALLKSENKYYFPAQLQSVTLMLVAVPETDGSDNIKVYFNGDCK